MKKILIFFFISFNYFNTHGQCVEIDLADPSFEDGTFPIGNPNDEPWIWNQTDGANISTSNAHSGLYSVCSWGGGVNQIVVLDSNTTYYLSCYVKNGQSDYSGPRFIINDITYPWIMVGTDNWTFISQSFNSGSDTLIGVGIESAGCCFDDFRLTCDPLTQNDGLMRSPIEVFPTISAEGFIIKAVLGSTINVVDINGRVMEQKQMTENSIYIGENFLPSLYIVSVRTNDRFYFQQIVKL